MLSFSANPGWLPNARSQLHEWMNPSSPGEDPATRYAREHPGTLRIGHVLCHGETFEGLEVSTLLVSDEGFVLLNDAGDLVLSIPRERVHGVECAPATEEGCRDPRPLQGEEHVFVRFRDEQERESHLEISVGAMDDIGPVRQLCDCLRDRLGGPEPATEANE
jgi:hypothetical protein